MLVVNPGVVITPEKANWASSTFPNLTRVDIGKGLHYIQEDHPHRIGNEISKWYAKHF